MPVFDLDKYDGDPTRAFWAGFLYRGDEVAEQIGEEEYTLFFQVMLDKYIYLAPRWVRWLYKCYAFFNHRRLIQDAHRAMRLEEVNRRLNAFDMSGPLIAGMSLQINLFMYENFDKVSVNKTIGLTSLILKKNGYDIHEGDFWRGWDKYKPFAHYICASIFLLQHAPKVMIGSLLNVNQKSANPYELTPDRCAEDIQREGYQKTFTQIGNARYFMNAVFRLGETIRRRAANIYAHGQKALNNPLLPPGEVWAFPDDKFPDMPLTIGKMRPYEIKELGLKAEDAKREQSTSYSE